MPKARIKSKLPIEIVVRADERHHTSVRKPRTHAYRRASEAPVSPRAVAVIRPCQSSSPSPCSFAPCLANASCTLVGTDLARFPEARFWPTSGWPTIRTESSHLAVNRGILTHPWGKKSRTSEFRQVFRCWSAATQKCNGNYQDKDQQTQQTKFNHRRVENGV